MGNEGERINCATYEKQERIIKVVTDKINMAKEPREKIGHAEELLKEVNVLLDCPEYNEKDTECSNCHFVSNVRRQTAELIIKTKKLI